MPVIIDANRAGDFSAPICNHAGEILNRISNKRIRVTAGGKLLKELFATKMRELLVEWERSGCLIRVPALVVQAEETLCSNLAIKSDDLHVLALARASGARLIYTDDKDLIKDFKNISFLSPKGKIVMTVTASKNARRLFDFYGS